MPQVCHTFACPFEDYSKLKLTVDVGMTGPVYDEALARGEYAALVDVPNWADVLDGDKPAFPLNRVTIDAMPFILQRYISTGRYVGDALDDYMEARSPNLNAG